MGKMARPARASRRGRAAAHGSKSPGSYPPKIAPRSCVCALLEESQARGCCGTAEASRRRRSAESTRPPASALGGASSRPRSPGGGRPTPPCSPRTSRSPTPSCAAGVAVGAPSRSPHLAATVSRSSRKRCESNWATEWARCQTRERRLFSEALSIVSQPSDERLETLESSIYIYIYISRERERE